MEYIPVASQFTEPVLIVGVGGAGSKLARQAGKLLGYDTMTISQDAKDADIRVSTEPVLNPSVHLLRGFALKETQGIRDRLDGYASIVMICNLAGKDGAAIAPVVSNIARGKNVACFAIMPFGYEKGRIFASGVALKRLRADADFVVVVDNDAVLDSNPDLTPTQCYGITNSAMLHVISSLEWPEMPGVGIVSAGRSNPDMETSLRDSLKVLYGSTRPGCIKRSIVYAMGGNAVPLGALRSVRDMASEVLGEGAQVEISANSSDASGIVMVSSVQGETRFDSYDPLGVIPPESTLDWDEPDCSMDCGLDFYQLE